MTIDTVVSNLFQVLTLASAFIGALSAWLIEHVNVFQKDGKGNERSPLAKKLIVTILSAVIGVVLIFVASFIGPDTVKSWNVPITALLTFGVTLLGTQGGHWTFNEILPDVIKLIQAFTTKIGPQG